MKYTKLFLIINKLPPTDIVHIEKKLKEESNKYALSLFKIFLEINEKEISKEKIYLRVYKEKYTKQKDARLRNEMKRLIDKIEKISIYKLIEEDIENDETFINKYRIQFYKKLSLEDELYNTINILTTELETKERYLDLFDTQFLYIGFKKNLNGNFDDIAANLTTIYKICEEAFYKGMAIQYKKLMYLKRYKNSASRFAIKNFIKTDWVDDNIVSIDTSKYSSLQSKYFDLSNFNSKLIEQKKVEDLLPFLSLVEQFEKYRQQHKDIFFTEYVDTLFYIATNLSYAGKYEDANIYFEKLFSIITTDNYGNYVYALFDYATNLNKLKQYNKGLSILNSIDKDILQKNPIWQTLYDAKIIMCYIGLKDLPNLYALLQKNNNEQSPFQKLYNRFGICSMYIINKDYVAAEEEMTNIIRTKLLKETLYEYVTLIEFFQYVLRQFAKYTEVEKIPEKNKQEIRSKIFEIDNYMFERVKGYFPYIIFIELLELKKI